MKRPFVFKAERYDIADGYLYHELKKLRQKLVKIEPLLE